MQKKTRKKLLVLLVSMTMLLGGLTACAQGAGSEPAADKSAEQTKEQTAEQTAEQTKEQAANETAEQTAEQTKEQAAGETAEQTTDQAAEQAAETAAGLTAEQAAEISTGRTAEQAAETAADRAVVPADQKIEDLLGKMTLREKVSQMFVASVRTWADSGVDTSEIDHWTLSQGLAGTEMQTLEPEVAAMISKERFGGMLFFGENCAGGNEKLLELVNDMQKANQDTDSECVIPLLMAADQEGGDVARLYEGTRGIGNMALTATGKEEYIEAEASIFGRELRSCGINTSFAPDIDVNNNPSNPVIGSRSFSDDPEVVAKNGITFMKAMGDEGIITSIKHFPGHGNTDTDSHTGLPMVNKTYEELKECELIPFQAAIDAGAEMLMTAHIQYPEVDSTKVKSISTGEEIYYPATLSHKILTEILRGDMGFEGVIVSDALNMDAITSHFGMEEACALTINAGTDLILIPIVVWNPETAQQMGDLLDTLTKKVENGEISEERINDSVTRILNMKEKHNLLDPVDTELTQEEKDAAADPVKLAEDQQTAWEHAEDAITLVKNEENLLPLTVKEDESVLFVFTSSLRPYTAEMAMARLKEKGLVPESVTYSCIAVSEETEEEAIEAAKKADHVIAVSSVFNTSGFNPASENGTASRIFDEVIDAAHEAGHKAVLLSGVLPYDAARYQAADAIMITYDSYGMEEAPEGVTAYIPNLIAGICCALGEFEPVGTLPVVIPKLDENYTFTKDVLYDRGYSLSYTD